MIYSGRWTVPVYWRFITWPVNCLLHRYAAQQRQQEQSQQSQIGIDGIFLQRQQQQQQQQQLQQQAFQRSGRKFTTDEPGQNFDTSGRFATRPSPLQSSPQQQGPLALSNSNIRQLLQQLDVAGSQQCNLNVQAQWDFETNVNEATQIRAVSTTFIAFIKKWAHHFGCKYGH